MTRAVFFDAGHTLIYAHPDVETVYAETTARFGVRVDPSRFAGVFGPVFHEFSRDYTSEGRASDAQDLAMWREITRRIHDRLDEVAAIDFEAWFAALYARFGEAEVWRFYDDVRATLESLRRRGYRLGVVSNWDTRLRSICGGLGLDRLVDFIVISAEVGARKPHPEIFRAALDRAGTAPGDTVHVGDLAVEDAEGARSVGIRPVLIDRGRMVGNAPEAVPVIGGLEELAPHLP